MHTGINGIIDGLLPPLALGPGRHAPGLALLHLRGTRSETGDSQAGAPLPPRLGEGRRPGDRSPGGSPHGRRRPPGAPRHQHGRLPGAACGRLRAAAEGLRRQRRRHVLHGSAAAEGHLARRPGSTSPKKRTPATTARPGPPASVSSASWTGSTRRCADAGSDRNAWLHQTKVAAAPAVAPAGSGPTPAGPLDCTMSHAPRPPRARAPAPVPTATARLV